MLPIMLANTFSSVNAVTIDYTLYDFVGHPIFELGSMLVMRILNQTTRGQTLHGEAYIWKLTSLLVVTLLKLILKSFCFQ